MTEQESNINNIINFFMNDGNNLNMIDELRDLLVLYTIEFKDNKELYKIFSDISVVYKYLDNELTMYDFIGYLKTLINYDNKLNLTNTEYLINMARCQTLIHSSMDKFDYVKGYKTYKVSDFYLYNDLTELLAKSVSNRVPLVMRKLFLIVIYKNIHLFGEFNNYNDLYLEVFKAYLYFLDDKYIIDYVKLNEIDKINEYNNNLDNLFNFLERYLINKINNNKQRIIR